VQKITLFNQKFFRFHQDRPNAAPHKNNIRLLMVQSKTYSDPKKTELFFIFNNLQSPMQCGPIIAQSLSRNKPCTMQVSKPIKPRRDLL